MASTKHDRFVDLDYARLTDIGIFTAREGLRWPLIEAAPGRYDFSSALPILEAAQKRGIEIIWDVFHFGWPSHLDIFSEQWIEAFGNFASAFGRVLRQETSEPVFVAPINEISFVAWAGGDVAYLNPFAKRRGAELKQQLVRGFIQASSALRAEKANVRLVSPEPVIHIVGDPTRARDVRQAAEYRSAMFEAWDMIAGRAHPELGGNESYLDIIGVNFYDRNEWWNFGKTIFRDEPQYRPFREILGEVHGRYRRPMFVAETGTENADRPAWLAYIAEEVRAAMASGTDMHGICLYPILNHPGWDDNRHCYNGLWDYADEQGSREIYRPLADELRHQQEILKEGVVDQLLSHTGQPDLLCLSHLRWNFVFQRPQHLMSRFAKERRVFFVEEPVYDSTEPVMRITVCSRTGVHIVKPHLPENSQPEHTRLIRDLLQQLCETHRIHRPIAWFYTPMAMDYFPAHVSPSALVYDCMDELSLFKGAPPRLRELEEELLRAAHLVFTGGVSLFEAKRTRHPQVHAFPSGVEVEHFAQARNIDEDFDELRNLPQPRETYPRLGYAGVIDERLDLQLVEEIARQRPNWQIVMIGPVVKINPDSLPRAANIHWLGIKDYADLPKYFAGWDVGIMPFALNDATRFISPTKTPEYLAAGLPVVSTPIRDVVHPYGDFGLAYIAADADEFVKAAERAMTEGMGFKWRQRADEFLQTLSWDSVWGSMNQLISGVINPKRKTAASASGSSREEVSARV